MEQERPGFAAAGERWKDRPVLSWSLRALAVLLPAGAATAVAVVLGLMFPVTNSVTVLAGYWMVVVASSTGAAWSVDKLTRHLIPLANLYRLTLLFPDRMPSRLQVVRQGTSLKHLERRIEEVRRNGLSDDFAEAAEQVVTLTTALTHHDRRTRGHSERVRVFADLLADELGMSQEDRDRFRWAALLHDIGKLRVPGETLNKDGRPSEQEWQTLQTHPSEGAAIVTPLEGWLGAWVGAVADHHERWDGSGYPRGLAGEEISEAGRIVSLVDAFEVMTATRAYKEPMPVSAARQELADCAGSHFDPRLVRAFLNISIGRLRWKTGVFAWLAEFELTRRPLGAPRWAALGGAAALTFGAVATMPSGPDLTPLTDLGAPVAVGMLAGGSTENAVVPEEEAAPEDEVQPDPASPSGNGDQGPLASFGDRQFAPGVPLRVTYRYLDGSDAPRSETVVVAWQNGAVSKTFVDSDERVVRGTGVTDAFCELNTSRCSEAAEDVEGDRERSALLPGLLGEIPDFWGRLPGFDATEERSHAGVSTLCGVAVDDLLGAVELCTDEDTGAVLFVHTVARCADVDRAGPSCAIVEAVSIGEPSPDDFALPREF